MRVVYCYIKYNIIHRYRYVYAGVACLSTLKYTVFKVFRANFRASMFSKYTKIRRPMDFEALTFRPELVYFLKRYRSWLMVYQVFFLPKNNSGMLFFSSFTGIYCYLHPVHDPQWDRPFLLPGFCSAVVSFSSWSQRSGRMRGDGSAGRQRRRLSLSAAAAAGSSRTEERERVSDKKQERKRRKLFY